MRVSTTAQQSAETIGKDNETVHNVDLESQLTQYNGFCLKQNIRWCCEKDNEPITR